MRKELPSTLDRVNSVHLVDHLVILCPTPPVLMDLLRLHPTGMYHWINTGTFLRYIWTKRTYFDNFFLYFILYSVGLWMRDCMSNTFLAVDLDTTFYVIVLDWMTWGNVFNWHQWRFPWCYFRSSIWKENWWAA